MPPQITIITPTLGRPSLDILIGSIEAQSEAGAAFHLLLWDDTRDAKAKPPEAYNGANRLSLVLPGALGRNGNAPGSPLRAVGLMAAAADWVTFADDDVRWEPDHLTALFAAAKEKNWASTLRTVWSPLGERLGVDRFQSVGDDPGRRVPDEMCDNNCMIFRRDLGSAAAVLYRETKDYNDDVLMYRFLKANAGPRGRTGMPTVHHTCPEWLVEFFRQNCSPS